MSLHRRRQVHWFNFLQSCYSRLLIVSRLCSELLSDYCTYRFICFSVTFYEYSVVLQAFVLTSAVFVGLTAYTLQSKRDFSKLGAGYFCLYSSHFFPFMYKFMLISKSAVLFARLFAALWILVIAGFMRVSAHSLISRSPWNYLLSYWISAHIFLKHTHWL